MHVEPGQRAPRAADHVEGPPAPRPARPDVSSAPAQRLGAACARRRHRLADPKHAEAAARCCAWTAPPLTSTSSRLPPPRSPTMPVGVGNGREHALAGQPAFLLAGMTSASKPIARTSSRKSSPLRGVAHRGGGDDPEFARPPSGRSAAGSGAAPPAPAPALLAGQPPGLAEPRAEPGHHLLVEDRSTATRGAPA